MIKGKFYNAQCAKPECSDELKQCIEKAYEKCLDSLDSETDGNGLIKPIMLLGKIQSGKTNAYTGLIALSFDNVFDMAIILTKNSKALVSQTYKRMKSEFKEGINNYEVQVIDIMNNIDRRLTEYELNKKIIIIAKKQTNNLNKIADFISKYDISSRKFCIVIDDEADITGIGFSKIKDSDDEFDLKAVASKVNSIRGSLKGYVFVQVTATPYALFLQPEFNENEIKSIKPQLPILVPTGKTYFGGEYFFIESKREGNPAKLIYEEVPINELEIISSPNGDRRRFREEEILIERNKLVIFKHGIMNFILGGCVLRMKDHNSHYSYVIHTNTQIQSHSRIEKITQIFYDQLRNRDKRTLPIIEDLIETAYVDIAKSIKAYGFEMPTLQEVKKEFYNAIDKDYISISIVNSENDVESLLNEDTGELFLHTPFSIFIGGQALDRGVTIPKMVGFYYMRNPKVMQQDTVMQHSRIFGYRTNDLLSIMRLYTTRRIFENLTKITEIDISLREDIENNRSEGIYFIQEDINGKIIPCSPQKIKMSNIVMLKPEVRILPIGFTPIKKKNSESISKEIDRILKKIIDEQEKNAVLISSNELEQIITLAYKAINPDKDSARFIKKDKYISTFRYLTQKEKEAYLIVRRGRKLSKFKDGGNLYSDSPDTPQDELQIAMRISSVTPTLMMIHEDGTGEGWNGREFWWPVLLVQRDLPKTVFSLDEPEGKIRQY
ncbi:MAG: Z1 domain-containing protein [Anaerolineaceae bacterium]